MPVPSWVRPRAAHPVEALEQVGQLVGGDAGPGVADGQLRRTAGAANADLDRPVESELEGVGKEVEDDLFPHVAVHVNRLGQRGAVHDQAQARPLHGGAEKGGQLGREGGQVGRLVGRLDAAGLDAREVEQRVDQLEQAEAVAVNGGQRLAVVGPGAVRPPKHFFQRPQQQGQRRAELVADVAEKGRLGPVQLGQRLRAAPRLFVGLGVGQGRGDLPGDEVVEGAVLGVEGPARTDGGDQKRRRPGAARRRDRQDQGGPRRDGPGAAGQGAESIGQALHQDGPAGFNGIGQRPCRGWPVLRALTRPGSPRFHQRRRGRRPRLQPRRAQQARLARGVVQQIEQREGNVVRVRGQNVGGGAADFFGSLQPGGAGGHVPQRPQAARPDHLLRRLRDRREDAADAAGFVADRTVGEGEIAFLGVAVPLHHQQQVVRPSRPARLQDAVQHGIDDRPDFGPDVPAATAQRGGVLDAENAHVRIVIEHDEVGAPPDDDGEARVEAGADGGAQALRPGRDRAERRGGPVEGPHPRPHLAAAGEAIQRGRFALYVLPAVHGPLPSPCRLLEMDRTHSTLRDRLGANKNGATTPRFLASE